MKKLILLAAFAVFGFTQVNAQVKFGAKAGANLANLVGDVEGNKMLFGFHVGAVAEFAVSEDFFVAPELLFSAQGYKVDVDDFDASLNLNYINLPIMAKYQVADGFTLEAGPQIGFLMSSKFKVEDESEDAEGLNDLDFGLNLGLGYRMENGLFFQGRYNIGLANVADDDDVKINNSVIQFSVGYFFN